jgi:nicotinamide-nucleotide amidase
MSAADRPRIEIVSTGTEILQGLYPDTNAQWLSNRLLRLGLPVWAHSAVGDSLDDLEGQLRVATTRSDILIVTGGLGPTQDDVNRYAIGRVYRLELTEDETAVEQMKAHFARRKRPFRDSNRVQAMIPRGARTLYNDWGTAPGFLIEGSGGLATLVALPGPPREMQPMFERHVQPYLVDRYRPEGGHVTLAIHTIDLPESEINAKIRDLFEADASIYVALLAQSGKVDIRLTGHGPDGDKVQQNLAKLRRRIEERVGVANVYGVDDETLEGAVGEMLARRGQTIAVAESCTGGMISSRLTNVAGASSYLVESIVTYSNESKIARLGVARELIERHGAVSAQVAEAMAAGVRRAAGADFGLSVTGIAGPTGGTAEKPVGLTYLGLAGEEGTTAVERRFLGNRNENRLYSTNAALDLLRRHLAGRTGRQPT